MDYRYFLRHTIKHINVYTIISVRAIKLILLKTHYRLLGSDSKVDIVVILCCTYICAYALGFLNAAIIS